MTPIYQPKPPYAHVIVATDGSDLAAVAVKGGAQLATQTGAELHIFHAALGLGTDEKVFESALRVVGQQSYTMTREVGPEAPSPAAVIASYAGELGDAVVAIGTHGRGGLGAALLGSTALDLVTSTDLTLLAYGPSAAPPTTIERVIACVDGSEFSELSLGEGARWALALQVPLWLVQVVPPGLPQYVSVFENTYVHNLARDIVTPDLELEWEVLHSLKPARALLESFGEDQANLVVMATHGRRGLSRLRLGSVATEVVRGSWGPVVLVPPARSLGELSQDEDSPASE